jgi:hypothetical protein
MSSAHLYLIFDQCEINGSVNSSFYYKTGRHLVIFELARVSQFCMIDLVVLHTRIVSRALGPWVTIFCLQSKGWPFLIGWWGIWALLLLQGSSKFDYHWFYFTGIRIYASGNSGSYIISSEAYFRILLAMVIAGVATTMKRTLSTLYFGRRMFGKSLSWYFAYRFSVLHLLTSTLSPCRTRRCLQAQTRRDFK